MTTKDSTIVESPVSMEEVLTPNTPEPGYEVTIINVLTQLAYQKWLMAKVTGIAALAGVTLALVLPVRYTQPLKSCRHAATTDPVRLAALADWV